MAGQTTRYDAGRMARAAEGWTLRRLTPPSRLYGANGIRTGADGRVYVAQVVGSQVSAIDVDSGAVEDYCPRGGSIVAPDDLVFDEAGNLYVTEITENRVRMLRPDGTSAAVWGDIPVANPITWHQGRLIAGELRFGARIMELDRHGGAPRVIVEGVPMANAFDVGPDGKLYFPAQGANEIWRVDLAGGEPEIVAKGLGVPDSVKFHPDGYIISTQVHSGDVLRIDPLTGKSSVLVNLGPGLDNVTFVGKRIFVSHSNGAIFEIEGNHARPVVAKGLQWPLGLAVAEDGEIFIADGAITYTLRKGGEMAFLGSLFTPGFPGWVRGVAAAGAGEWIVTTANGVVARWRPAGQEHETLATGYDRLMGVAVAANGAVVFAEKPTGRVLSIEGGGVSELARGLDAPMGIALASDGTVYVSEAGAGRVVRRAGARTETVIDGLAEPHGIAIVRDKLYALDVGAKRLIESDLAGTAQAVIAEELPIGAPKNAVSLQLGGVGDFCGPMNTFSGIVAGPAGSLYLAADTEGSVIELSAS